MKNELAENYHKKNIPSKSGITIVKNKEREEYQ